jgi:hypothetical protein
MSDDTEYGDEDMIRFPDDEPLPGWISDPKVWACERCWEEEHIIVPIGLSDHIYDLFCKNAIELTCPRCAYCIPRHSTIQGKPADIKWVPMHLSYYHGAIREWGVWRIPERRKSLEFIDSDTMAGPNSRKQTPFSVLYGHS